jgi:CDGSH-type Zn-finger protein
MTEATIAQKAPYPVQVEAGKSYFWCTCGNSAKQPFCDGSHKGGAFAPLKYTAEKDGVAWFCGWWRALIGRAAMEGASAAAPPAPCRRSARASA